MTRQPDFQRRLEAIEMLVGKIETVADPALQAATRELMELVMDLHGRALSRIMEMLSDGGESGEHWIEKLGRDDLVSSLLVLHSLHPVSMEARVNRAIEGILPALKKQGAVLDVVALSEDALTLKLQVSRRSSSIKEMVEDAIYQAAPDLGSLVIEDSEKNEGFVPLEMLLSAAGKGAL